MIWRAFLHQQDGSISSAKLHRSRSNTMNGYQLSAKPFSEREIDLQRVSDFHAVLLGMAAHDLRQPLQVIQSTYEWLSGRFDAEADRMRLQRGERAVARLAEQLDRLAAALRLYQHTTMMELSPVPLAPLFDSVGAENGEFARGRARFAPAAAGDPEHVRMAERQVRR
jgi:signal transduction histidine kinase